MADKQTEEGLHLQTLAEIEEALNLLDTNNRGDLPEISRLTTLQNELLAQQALQERVLVQETKVESIQLPYDFNEVFGDPRANDIVIELIKDLQRQAYAEHNAEVETLISEHKEEIAHLKYRHESEVHALVEEKLTLIADNKILSQRVESIDNELHDTLKTLGVTSADLTDALSKRDAAAEEIKGLNLLLSEKQEHIERLRDEIAVGAKAAINITNISPSDKLAQLIQESKNAKVKSALDIALENAAPFRGKVTRDGEVVAQLEVPQVSPFPVINPSGNTDLQLVIGPASEDTTGDQVNTPSEEVSAVSAGLVEGSSSEDGQGEKTLEERVRQLELHVFGA